MKKLFVCVAAACLAAGTEASSEIELPPCGVLVGNAIYNYFGFFPAMYGWGFTAYWCQHASPLELVERTVKENQGNIIQFWPMKSDRPPTVEKDLCSMTGWLSEEEAQQEIHVALKRCLVAAGALARRIGSSTYEGWRQLLVDHEFCQRQGSYFFGSEREFKAFHSKLTELTHLLWADNEIARQISIAQNTPHTSKNTPKKRGV